MYKEIPFLTVEEAQHKSDLGLQKKHETEVTSLLYDFSNKMVNAMESGAYSTTISAQKDSIVTELALDFLRKKSYEVALVDERGSIGMWNISWERKNSSTLQQNAPIRQANQNHST